MTRYICVHGHFYQPPRENPWLEKVELQDSAYPYHDWNQRITAECYAPNAAARILDADGRIARIVNNYERMSFSIGPTLLAWMESAAPDTYAAIIGADRASVERFSGHGCAVAQTFNHTILPLAPRRDKSIQVAWGVRDFVHRFGRAPEGMWLAETAVDLETLDVLAEHGIRFTVLAPHQAGRVRPVEGGAWHDVQGAHVDPTTAYLQKLPSGRTIALFFFDEVISRAIVQERLLTNGQRFAERLLDAFDDRRGRPELVHYAHQGETYGHYHRNGEMALAYAMQLVEGSDRAKLTNYGEFLELHPPTQEVEILERTSWSCSHELGRWSRDCGCNTGERPQWHQRWRAPLRQAMTSLRDDLDSRFDAQAAELLRDPWAARFDFIDIILDRSPGNVRAFVERHAARGLDDGERTRALMLLEMQRQSQLMMTSSGWFFDDLSRMESVQVLLYACRALQLAADCTLGPKLDDGFLEILRQAPSNIPEHVDGAEIWRKWVEPAQVDLARVGAHYAVSSLLAQEHGEAELFCYEVTLEDEQAFDAGTARVVVGRAEVRSTITLESARLGFGVLHFGDHNVSAGVGLFTEEQAYGAFVSDLGNATDRGDIPEVVRLLDKHFGGAIYSVQSLFRDMRRRFLNLMLESTLTDDEAIYRQLYERHMPLIRFLSTLDAPLPTTFRTAAEVVINSELRQAFASDAPDHEHVAALLHRAESWGVKLDVEGHAYTFQQTIERLAVRLRDEAAEPDSVRALERVVALARTLPFDVDFSNVQTAYYQLWRRVYVEMLEHVDEGDDEARIWSEHFVALGESLGVRVAEMRDHSEMTTVASLVQDILASARAPRATYRLQLSPEFTFEHAEQIVDYLDSLGISDCYASPILTPRAGSTHGYDICDHSAINPVIGGEAAFESFSNRLIERDMGLVLDTVPNHMGIGDVANQWWNDVLENGPASLYSAYFDIDWHPVKPELANKVLLPILEDQYGRVLEAGKLQLIYEDGAFHITHYGLRLPVAPRTYSQVLALRLDALTEVLGADDELLQEYQSVLTALSYLPKSTETDPERVVERQREKEVIKRRIDTLVQASPQIRAAVDVAVATFNGVVGDPHSFDLLDLLIESQAYRPAFWRVAAEEINYRRFFDINELAAIRPEEPEVFDAIHDLVFRYLVEGRITGLRIDHLDGLYDPAGYLHRLQQTYVHRQCKARLEAVRDEVPDDAVLAKRVEARTAALFEQSCVANREEPVRWPLYVVAEKILAEGESVPRDWAAAGSTGYDFLAITDGLFVRQESAGAFDEIYGSFCDGRVRFRNLVNETKKMTMLVSMASEIYSLSHRLERIAEKNRRYRDFTLDSLTFAIREVIAGLSVYRTYITEDAPLTDRDRTYIESAVAVARRRNPRTAAALFDFIRDTLLLSNLDDFTDENRGLLTAWVRKFQQVTGPVMAKGVEDTAFYVYNRLVSLNEVGNHPEHFGSDVATFHARSRERQACWPLAMLSSSTHDTKRSEDVRARINVLSEMPEAWGDAVLRWKRLNADHKADPAGVAAPDSNDEYLFYQTVLGAWPMEWTVAGAPPRPVDAVVWNAFRERIAAYMSKATKEAKTHTSWVNPNASYDQAVRQFVFASLSDDPDDAFVRHLQGFVRGVAFHGRLNALSALALRLTAPGVPDVYQGNELWDLSLVDPDNRRPVDFELRRRFLSELDAALSEAGDDRAGVMADVLANAHDGRVKLMILQAALRHRRACPALYADGRYEPIEAVGAKAGHVVAYRRATDSGSLVVAVPRLVVGLTEGQDVLPMGEDVWGDTFLPLPFGLGDRLRNLITAEWVTVEERGGEAGVFVGAVTRQFPIVMLVNE